jgi:hypothetical protein
MILDGIMLTPNKIGPGKGGGPNQSQGLRFPLFRQYAASLYGRRFLLLLRQILATESE